MTISYEIRSRYTGKKQLIVKIGCSENDLPAIKMVLAVKRAHLEGMSFENAYLKDASLEGAYLKGASLEGANLEGANLEGASLKGSRLEGTNLKGTNLEGAIFAPAWKITKR